MSDPSRSLDGKLSSSQLYFPSIQRFQFGVGAGVVASAVGTMKITPFSESRSAISFAFVSSRPAGSIRSRPTSRRSKMIWVIEEEILVKDWRFISGLEQAVTSVSVSPVLLSKGSHPNGRV